MAVEMIMVRRVDLEDIVRQMKVHGHWPAPEVTCRYCRALARIEAAIEEASDGHK